MLFYIKRGNIAVLKTHRRNCIFNIKNELFYIHKTSANAIKDAKYRISSLYRQDTKKIFKILYKQHQFYDKFNCRCYRNRTPARESDGCLFVR
jgi:hypothetical protein